MFTTSKVYQDYVVFVDCKSLRGRSDARLVPGDTVPSSPAKVVHQLSHTSALSPRLLKLRENRSKAILNLIHTHRQLTHALMDGLPPPRQTIHTPAALRKPLRESSIGREPPSLQAEKQFT